MDGDRYQDVVRSRLKVLHEDIPITVAFENACIDQLILVILEAASAVLLNQQLVWIFVLRILVEHLQIRMGWRGVQIVVILLDIFAVVSLCVA
jgi:hypothetical protein